MAQSPTPELSNMARLLRFLHVGTHKNVLVCSSRDTPVAAIVSSLEMLPLMVLPQRETFPYDIIKKVMQSGKMLRRDEGFMALAYCVRRIPNDKLREHIFKNIQDVMITDEDLFMFVHYATLLLNRPPAAVADGEPDTVRASHQVGFGRGMKRAVSNWYHNKTPAELADILGRHRGLYTWTHRDLFMLCHIKFHDTDVEKIQIIKAMFNRGVKVLNHMNDPTIGEQPQGSMQRLCDIFRFKICEDVRDGAEMFVQHKFDVDHLPSHFLIDAEFWKIALPLVPYDRMLRSFLTLHGYGLIEKVPELLAVLRARLANAAEVQQSGLHPLYLLGLVNGYQTNMRYAEINKSNWYTKNRVLKYKAESNPELVQLLQLAVNHSFANLAEPSPSMIFVTLDLRRNDLNRKVFNMEHLNCIEAMACLSLGILKRNTQHVRIFAFTDNDRLRELPILAGDTFAQAYQKCLDSAIEKTVQSLGAPIKLAIGPQPIHFVTMFSSVARIVRQGIPEFIELEKYRKRHSHSRYLVMNLGRHTQDLHSYPDLGLLEICGLTPKIMLLVEAYLSNKFY